MGRIKHSAKTEAVKELAIFAILFSDGKSVFIGKGNRNRLKSIYKDHYILRNAKTKELFEKEKESGTLPGMYLLQSVDTSPRLAFRYCIAWTKYFLDNGYTLLPKLSILQEYAEDMIDDTKRIYEDIKSVNIKELLVDDKNLFPNYGVGRKVKAGDVGTKITISVTGTEYVKIYSDAKQNGLSLSNYCKRMVLNGQIIKADFGFITAYLGELNQDKQLLRQILHTIYVQGDYYPADLENIQRLIEHITELQKEAHKEIDKVLNTL